MWEILGMVERLVSEAVVLWISGGPEPYPSPRDERVVQRFGEDTAGRLLPMLRSLESDVFASDARHHVADLQEMGNRVAAELRTQHPELTEDAVRVLVNLYTYAYK